MRHVPDESLSRVSAYDWFGSLAFQPLGLAIWGPIAEVIGISRRALGGGGARARDDAVAARRCRRSGTCARARFHPVRSEHVFVPYVELHAHTAFSFLDGASSPAELAAAAAELGHEAMAVVDHNGVSGSMEFAQAAAPLGLRAIHGVEIVLEDERHVTLLVEDAVGWRNLCRIVTRAHVHDRDPREPPPAVPLGDAGGVLGRPRLPERVRRSRRPRRADAAAAAGCLRPRPSAGRAAAAVPAPRPRAQPFAGAARAEGRRAHGGDRQRARARAHPRAAAGRVRRAPPPPDAGRVGARAARQHRARAGVAGGDGRPLRGPRARRSRRAASWRSGCASTSRRTSATAIPGRRIRRRRASSPSCAGRCSRCAIRATTARRMPVSPRSCG